MFSTQRINLRVFKPDMMKLCILLISRSYNNVVLLLWKPEFKNKYELSTTLQNKTSSCFCIISIFWWCSGSVWHQKHFVKVSEINNRVQSHTQSCECLRVWLCCVWSSLFSGPDGYWPASEPGLRCTDWIYCWASFSTFPLTCLETLEEFWIVFWPTDGSFQSRIRTFKTLEARWKHRAVFFSSVFGPLR